LSARKACGSVREMHQQAVEPLSTHDDMRWMRMALAAARRAAAADEVPIGAVLVRDGLVLSVAHNSPIRLHDPTAHAEILALRDAAQTARDYRLPGTTLYVTAEPCVMCVGALIHARVRHLVFGCREPKSGAVACFSPVGASVPVNHRFTFREGVCADEALSLLQEFFRVRRGA
jgi:tRNA(adenine34) deaminase